MWNWSDLVLKRVLFEHWALPEAKGNILETELPAKIEDINIVPCTPVAE
jgi:hypothetical protein